MGYSERLGPPIVAASIATLAFTNFAAVMVVKSTSIPSLRVFETIWPILLTSTVATILTMSLLYRSILQLMVELEAKEQLAQRHAVHDHLTGLVNRTLLEDRLGSALGRLKRQDENFALMLLDLDRFKSVNDTLGHCSGDLLLQQVGERLRSLVRETDTVARIGGDEFAILQSDIQARSDVRQLCDRIIARLGEPYHLGDREAHVGVTIGAIIASGDMSNASELIRKADITMYKAKSAGRNCYRMFSDEMDAEVQRQNLIEAKLRQALDTGVGFGLHYQPQLSPAGKVLAIEGLLRWTDDQLGEISPAEVIPVAEDCGLIDRLGEVTFREACQAVVSTPDIVVAVNLSPLQFRKRNLVCRLLEIAREEKADVRRIEIELTESAFIEHAHVSEKAIAELRNIGFRIALDDFGTGYSSLSYLQRFPVDKIKLDEAFFQNGNSGDCLRLVSAAVSLGHALNLEVVAEGISNPQQEEIAIASGCDLLQGFRYSPAVPLNSLPSFRANIRQKVSNG